MRHSREICFTVRYGEYTGNLAARQRMIPPMWSDEVSHVASDILTHKVNLHASGFHHLETTCQLFNEPVGTNGGSGNCSYTDIGFEAVHTVASLQVGLHFTRQRHASVKELLHPCDARVSQVLRYLTRAYSSTEHNL